MNSTVAEHTSTGSGPAPSAPRLWLEPATSHRPLLDGSWWPRSRRLDTELPGLVRALDDRLDSTTHILVGPDDWDDHPKVVEVAGHTVRVFWFTGFPHDLLIATSLSGDRLDLMVVPATTEPATAHAAAAMAGMNGNTVHAPDILANVNRLRDAATAEETAWESEGGHLGSNGSTGGSSALPRPREAL
ncbi:DUF5994 family protein [Nocardiopsis ansamitocini]|uniref:Uncharacterized protein n=1 Tax=Nocardiopsis ansamitocini TaxID=1670832 RepID=A0A9W6P9I0_9ACTN|nr:DUF5994 family protein [Nocardiopsis ansamitocini]GLU50084.1 hypothetical protein Nans01_44350 [Nocardiopsis ansamitocini]